MKIGILGSGMVGKTLASGFLKHGYEVMIGTSNLSKLQEWNAANPQGRLGSFAETAAFGEILVLATKGHATIEVLKMAGLDKFNGKVVIDATNPIDESKKPVNGVLSFYTTDKSQLELLQEVLTEAFLVKAFSSVGSALMVNPELKGGKPSMFIAGNDEKAKTAVANILDQFGWEVEDVGAANAAGSIEQLCILWCIPGFLNGDWVHAFKVLRK